MTLQEQNQLKPGSIFYFLEPGPMQWKVENGVMRGSTAFFIRTAFFVRMNYMFNPSLGKRQKCVCCITSKYYRPFSEAQAMPRQFVPIKLCYMKKEQLEKAATVVREKESKALKDYIEREKDRIKKELEQAAKQKRI